MVRFERYAAAQKWKVDRQLISALQGCALDIMLFYPQEKITDYDALKTAFLKRFDKTEEEFRLKFRRCRPEIIKLSHNFQFV